MARIDVAPEVGEDVARILNYLEEHQSSRVSSTNETTIGAVDLLQMNPLDGRPGPSGNRELIIGNRRSGYVVLYQYFEDIDQVIVPAVRSQRERGYARQLAGLETPGKTMKTSGPESEDSPHPAKAKIPQWRVICDIVNVLAIAYFVFLVVAILIAPKGTRNWAVFALHFGVTIVLGCGAKWYGSRYGEGEKRTSE